MSGERGGVIFRVGDRAAFVPERLYVGGEAVEHAVVLEAAQVEHRGVVSDEVGQVGGDEHLVVEPEDREADVSFMVAVACFDSVGVGEPLEVFEGDPDAGRDGQRGLFDSFAAEGQPGVRIAQQEATETPARAFFRSAWPRFGWSSHRK